MYLPEYFKQLGIGDRVWVEVYPRHFGVSSLTCHDIIVGWIVEITTRVAGDDVADAGDVQVARLGTPETASSQSRLLCGLWQICR